MIVLCHAYECHCERCGHEWIATHRPGRCAHCKSRRWNRRGDIELPLQDRISFSSSDGTISTHILTDNMTRRMDLP